MAIGDERPGKGQLQLKPERIWGLWA